MYIDAFNELGRVQAFSSSGNSTNVLDLGTFTNTDGNTQTGQLGDGEPMAVMVDVDVAPYAVSGDETYSLALTTDSNVNLTTSPVTLATLTIARTAALNSQFVLPVPPKTALKQYLGTILTLGGTNPAITLSQYLLPISMIQKYQSYLDNSTIK